MPILLNKLISSQRVHRVNVESSECILYGGVFKRENFHDF